LTPGFYPILSKYACAAYIAPALTVEYEAAGIGLSRQEIPNSVLYLGPNETGGNGVNYFELVNETSYIYQSTNDIPNQDEDTWAVRRIIQVQ
jgi:hypothetical protein